MRTLFITLSNANGDVATVRGRNEFGEYVITFNETTYYPSRSITKSCGTAYETELDSACYTAIAGNFR